jgi:hypothetical protein
VARRTLTASRWSERVAACSLAVACTFAPLAGPIGAFAQAYETLHVRHLTMTVDRNSVGVGEPFHLSISVHVDEEVVQLDNLTLPDLSGFDSLGDERRCVATTAGSDCTETVTLAATVPGTRTISGATLDAIDARNGRPSRFTSNAVTLTVTGSAASDPLRDVVSGVLYVTLRAFLIVLLIGVAIFALLWGFVSWRRGAPPRPVVPARAPTPAEPVAAPDPNARLRDLATTLGREPTRANALRMRFALRETMHARDEETLRDLMVRRAADPSRLASLAAIERAAFCEDERVSDAVREALPSLNF